MITYSEFVNNLSYAFDLLISTLTGWANALMSNYFVITILGVALFSSFVLFIVDHLFIDNIKAKSNSDNLYN